jgi:hypothetical protein
MTGQTTKAKGMTCAVRAGEVSRARDELPFVHGQRVTLATDPKRAAREPMLTAFVLPSALRLRRAGVQP